MGFPAIVFNIIDIVIGAYVVFAAFIGSLFMILFGLIIIVYVLWQPTIITQYFGLVNSWLGYGLFILYLGVASWGSNHIVVWIIGALTVVMGFIYIILHFVKCVDKPGPLLGKK
ncbi:uncharacterized protein MONOS_2413 [Monocercomonoides exilis]|uniref:uncharacterized protein n=1 Tax=Monocercomonoides exilis TaxID=2049356 RepID=UPI003559C54E|nr:hypothetical protein MONOS_2413 [Monocercomonoides exilis]|eukprot:MONOS_2413.1-p1 / transcript=MONOS_2413.1 / gene=MONOS_2413 / organism=Monocercomonoides_exilis_PA203 / gene_product=unspecified product / transcript_product=unspecified product / location=Mono_scaffold00049:148396-148894(-) / protein_length=113 / sequence_SO=supercontig / SO=protein_coding / is_pseudo=false